MSNAPLLTDPLAVLVVLAAVVVISLKLEERFKEYRKYKRGSQSIPSEVFDDECASA